MTKLERLKLLCALGFDSDRMVLLYLPDSPRHMKMVGHTTADAVANSGISPVEEQVLAEWLMSFGLV